MCVVGVPLAQIHAVVCTHFELCTMCDNMSGRCIYMYEHWHGLGDLRGVAGGDGKLGGVRVVRQAPVMCVMALPIHLGCVV